MPKFKVGDKVNRLQNVFDNKSRLMHGVIIEVYSKTTKWGHYPELYKVIWDGDKISEGYLPHGLNYDE